YIDAHAGRERAFAAGTCRRAEAQRGHERVRVLVDEERERFELLGDGWRPPHRQGHEGGVLGGSGDFEDDCAVLGLNLAIAEGLLPERGPHVSLPLRRESEEE